MKDNPVRKATEMKGLLSLPVITLALTLNASAQSKPFSVMFYNTENFFDTVNDTLKDDEEFLPEGVRHWTKSRYIKKTDCIARVIVATGGWEAPYVAGLCEVENEKVVKDLVNCEILKAIDYSYIHYDSPDKRGIDLCLLYRKDAVTILKAESWLPVMPPGSKGFDSRNSICVKTRIEGDTINFIVCHWPSRRGGLLASAEQRSIVSDMIVHRIDSMRKTMSAGEKIILMGDFNCNPDFNEIRNIEEHGNLVNLSSAAAEEGEGTYKFRGKWEMIDQIMVSDGMMKSRLRGVKSYEPAFEVACKDLLLEPDPDYPGRRPASTYRGYRWTGGCSDHLPVKLTLVPKD